MILGFNIQNKFLRYFFYIELVLLCFVFSISNKIYAESKTILHSIQVVSFNILAPCYAIPNLYPPGANAFLERAPRRDRTLVFLKSLESETDIFALQEMTEKDFPFFQQAFQKEFYSFHVNHDPNYWSNWITPELPWEPNGVSLFIKKTAFKNVSFSDLALSRDGNHAAYFEGIHSNSNSKIRGASVHLDSERASNRNQELKALLKFIRPNPTTKDFIAGDFNSGTHNGVIKYHLKKNNFTDALGKLDKEEWTSPYSEGEYKSKNLGIIDHIVTRNATPIAGQVFNFGVWQRHSSDQAARILANLKHSGSDHFPLYAKFAL